MTVDNTEQDLKRYYPIGLPIPLLKFMGILIAISFGLTAVYELFIR